MKLELGGDNIEEEDWSNQNEERTQDSEKFDSCSDPADNFTDRIR